MAEQLSVIVRTVKRYICPYCHRGHSRRRAAEEHLTICVHNPHVRSCRTCIHHHPAIPDGWDEPGSEERCERGLLTTGHIARSESLPRQCPGWVPSTYWTSRLGVSDG